MRNRVRNFYTDSPTLFDGSPEPGSFNDEAVVRGLVTEVIRGSQKSREQIAEEMSVLLGERVTARMLNSYTSEAAEKHRWPAHFTRAFCFTTSDWRLLRCIAERAGFHLIDDNDAELLELGRQYLVRKNADEQIATFERRLLGRAL